MFYKLIFTTFLCILLGLLYISRVDNTITQEDKEFIQKILDENKIKNYSGKSYQEEVAFIENVLNGVFTVAPSGEGLPLSSLREPRQIYLSKQGACFDKSRVMEKIFRDNGFQTRHVSSFLNKNNSKIKTLATPGIESHAATEVLTKKGWLVLGTYEKWLALDENNLPYSSEGMRKAESRSIKWKYPIPPSSKYYYGFKESQMVIVYGLYSRHGKFYPPYNFIPDIEYSEFLYNFFNLEDN